MSLPIDHTPGEIAYYVPTTDTQQAGPLAAIIASSNGDGTVNLMVILGDGNVTAKQRVPYIADGNVPADGGYCY